MLFRYLVVAVLAVLSLYVATTIFGNYASEGRLERINVSLLKKARAEGQISIALKKESFFLEDDIENLPFKVEFFCERTFECEKKGGKVILRTKKINIRCNEDECGVFGEKEFYDANYTINMDGNKIKINAKGRIPKKIRIPIRVFVNGKLKEEKEVELRKGRDFVLDVNSYLGHGKNKITVEVGNVFYGLKKLKKEVVLYKESSCVALSCQDELMKKDGVFYVKCFCKGCFLAQECYNEWLKREEGLDQFIPGSKDYVLRKLDDLSLFANFCKEGDVYCDNNILSVCHDGVWVPEYRCKCENNACVGEREEIKAELEWANASDEDFTPYEKEPKNIEEARERVVKAAWELYENYNCINGKKGKARYVFGAESLFPREEQLNKESPHYNPYAGLYPHGNTPPEKSKLVGLDCSGLVWFVFAELARVWPKGEKGTLLDSRALDFYKRTDPKNWKMPPRQGKYNRGLFCKYVQEGKIKPGDIVIFSKPQHDHMQGGWYESHAGIFLQRDGKNYILHAPGPRCGVLLTQVCPGRDKWANNIAWVVSDFDPSVWPERRTKCRGKSIPACAKIK